MRVAHAVVAVVLAMALSALAAAWMTLDATKVALANAEAIIAATRVLEQFLE